VQDVDDILDELEVHWPLTDASQGRRQAGPSKGSPALSEAETTVLDAVGPYPVHLDDLAARVPMEIGPLTAVLVQLEIRGLICQDPGNYYARHMDLIEE